MQESGRRGRRHCSEENLKKQGLLRLDKSRISKEKLSLLQRLFPEAKLFTNYIIANGKTMPYPYERASQKALSLVLTC